MKTETVTDTHVEPCRASGSSPGIGVEPFITPEPFFPTRFQNARLLEPIIATAINPSLWVISFVPESDEYTVPAWYLDRQDYEHSRLMGPLLSAKLPPPREEPILDSDHISRCNRSLYWERPKPKLRPATPTEVRVQRLRQRDDRRRNKESFRINKLVKALVKSLRPERDDNSPLRPPCWTGEPRPFGARGVPCRSQFPSIDYLIYLVTELGYDGSAAFAALSRADRPWTKSSDRGQSYIGGADEQSNNSAKGRVNRDYSPLVSGRPYYLASPVEYHTFGGGASKKKVTEAIARHGWDDAHNNAVYEIVYLRRKPFLVAASLGLKVETVYTYCRRVRADLQKT